MERFSTLFYLSFSRRERAGILGLIALIILTWFLPDLFPETGPPEITKADTSLTLRPPTFPTRFGEESIPGREVERPKSRHFAFDPNTLSPAGWKDLGLKEKTIQTILKFREKGGRFYTPEDLGRIYGLGQVKYEELRPWVRIPKKPDTEKPTGAFKPYQQERTRSSLSILGINSADTSAWIALPGIGSKLASRIVAYREKLGGFYSIAQLREVYGISDSVFQKMQTRLQEEPALLQKMDVNTVTEKDLGTHPYFRGKLATLLSAYRQQHGAFKNLEALKNIPAITDDIFQKISPYLKL